MNYIDYQVIPELMSAIESGVSFTDYELIIQEHTAALRERIMAIMRRLLDAIDCADMTGHYEYYISRAEAQDILFVLDNWGSALGVISRCIDRENRRFREDINPKWAITQTSYVLLGIPPHPDLLKPEEAAGAGGDRE